jgi:hypothetical protein
LDGSRKCSSRHMLARKMKATWFFPRRNWCNCCWQKLAFRLMTTIIICSLGIFLATIQWDWHTLSIDWTQAWLILSLIGCSLSHSRPVKSQQQDWEWVCNRDKWVRNDVVSDMPGVRQVPIVASEMTTMQPDTSENPICNCDWPLALPS